MGHNKEDPQFGLWEKGVQIISGGKSGDHSMTNSEYVTKWKIRGNDSE